MEITQKQIKWLSGATVSFVIALVGFLFAWYSPKTYSFPSQVVLGDIVAVCFFLLALFALSKATKP